MKTRTTYTLHDVQMLFEQTADDTSLRERVEEAILGQESEFLLDEKPSDLRELIMGLYKYGCPRMKSQTAGELWQRALDAWCMDPADWQDEDVRVPFCEWLRDECGVPLTGVLS